MPPRAMLAEMAQCFDWRHDKKMHKNLNFVDKYFRLTLNTLFSLMNMQQLQPQLILSRNINASL